VILDARVNVRPRVAPAAQIKRAAAVLNGGRRPIVFAGHGPPGPAGRFIAALLQVPGKVAAAGGVIPAWLR